MESLRISRVGDGAYVQGMKIVFTNNDVYAYAAVRSVRRF
jgi:hypothetical protein